MKVECVLEAGVGGPGGSWFYPCHPIKGVAGGGVVMR